MVSNGRDINVWWDAWLPGNSSIKVPTPTVYNNIELQVSDLIDMERGTLLEPTSL